MSEVNWTEGTFDIEAFKRATAMVLAMRGRPPQPSKLFATDKALFVLKAAMEKQKGSTLTELPGVTAICGLVVFNFGGSWELIGSALRYHADQLDSIIAIDCDERGNLFQINLKSYASLMGSVDREMAYDA